MPYGIVAAERIHFMRKQLAGILAVFMLCMLVSCGDTPPEDSLIYTTPPAATDDTAETTETTAETELEPPPVLPEPTLVVTEEIDWEHRAVKIILNGDGMYYFPNTLGEWVENYQYRLGVNSAGYTQDFPLPMEPAVTAYYPISRYIRETSPIEICKVDANGKIYRVEYDFSIDIASLFSDEPIRLQDEFLHAVMTDYFGGEYSERDLLEITYIFVSYHNLKFQSHDRTPNYIQIRKNMTDPPVNYYYSDFFDTPVEQTPSVIPETMLEDLKRFYGLTSLELVDQYDPERQKLYLKIAQEVSRGYQVTENTWD